MGASSSSFSSLAGSLRAAHLLDPACNSRRLSLCFSIFWVASISILLFSASTDLRTASSSMCLSQNGFFLNASIAILFLSALMTSSQSSYCLWFHRAYVAPLLVAGSVSGIGAGVSGADWYAGAALDAAGASSCDAPHLVPEGHHPPVWNQLLCGFDMMIFVAPQRFESSSPPLRPRPR